MDTKIYAQDCSDVNLVQHQDYNQYLDKDVEQRQDLPGFQGDYCDIVDYILKITHRIWEEKGIGLIYDTYHNDVVIHSGNETTGGVAGVIANTLQTLYAFPDRRLIGEDVVWSEDTPGVFYNSHRILSIGTNTGDSSFGPATGRKIQYRTIAETWVTENRIFEEWLVRDNLWIVEQLGIDAKELARKLAKATNKAQLQRKFGINETMEGQFFPERYKAKDDSVGEWLLELHNDIFNYKMINRVTELFSDNAILNYICNRQMVGHDEIQGCILALLSSFPNAKFSIERITINNQPDGSDHISMRWRMRGMHDGYGVFGDPTGKPVEILGVTQYRVENRKISEGWVIYDGLDILRQLAVAEQDDADKETEK